VPVGFQRAWVDGWMCEKVHLGGAEFDADAEHDPQYYNVHDSQNRLGCPGSSVLHVDNLRGRAGNRFDSVGGENASWLQDRAMSTKQE
jgi:hypothetical protein